MTFVKGLHFPTIPNTAIPAKNEPPSLLEQVIHVAKKIGFTNREIASRLRPAGALKDRELICFYSTEGSIKCKQMKSHFRKCALLKKCMFITEDLYQDTSAFVQKKYSRNNPGFLYGLQTEYEMMRRKVFGFYCFLLEGDVNDAQEWERFFTACIENPVLLKLATTSDKTRKVKDMLEWHQLKCFHHGISVDEEQRLEWISVAKNLLAHAFAACSPEVQQALSIYLKDEKERDCKEFLAAWQAEREQAYAKTVASLLAGCEKPYVLVSLDDSHQKEHHTGCIAARLCFGPFPKDKDDQKKA